ncbi:MAG: putative addiction module antidote protein [Sphingomonadales bacterium]|nr:putative addiction module antidote protein [Sphingomonadales bacterium]
MTIELQDFDEAEYLDSDVARETYLREAFATGDSGHIATALGVVARAKGISDLARETGLSRGALYKAFAPDGNPTLDTVLKVTRQLGIRLDARLVTKP